MLTNTHTHTSPGPSSSFANHYLQKMAGGSWLNPAIYSAGAPQWLLASCILVNTELHACVRAHAVTLLQQCFVVRSLEWRGLCQQHFGRLLCQPL